MNDERSGPVRGIVRTWHGADGWGVIDSDFTPGGCWFLFSVVRPGGRPSLAAGDSVWFRFEQVADQDGYRFRALSVTGSVDDDTNDEESSPSVAYRSKLVIAPDT